MGNNLREQIQSQVVQLITKGLEDGSISEDRAREIARLILNKVPENVSNEELMQILPKLDDEFFELTEVVLPIISDYEEKIRKAVEQKALEFVRQRKFQEALDTARKGIEYTKQIT
jgi:hypothetical protein